ncbi:mannose-1-phosphate guanylyltransferase [Betaproteobacteria bacterium]|nr:mannose-1-phosphate guanylyltransferase [Betaproteobacteria bacterium]
MRTMILAAGRGERMRPLTDTTPKPLLPVGGKPLIVWHLERLAAAGFRHVIINVSHLGDQFLNVLGDGAAWNLHIVYSPEPPGALETAGGVARVLPLLGEQPFLLINGDIFCDWDPAQALTMPFLDKQAHLLLVDNPTHHPQGDFNLGRDGKIGGERDERNNALTFAGIGIYSPRLFAGVEADRPAKLAPLLYAAAAKGLVTGERFDGQWVDVGTPERLILLDEELKRR